MDNFVRVVIIQYSIEKWMHYTRKFEWYVELHPWLNDIGFIFQHLAPLLE